jgi:hypothetical protein
VRAVRVAAPPAIDGRLDDAAWQGAALLEPLVQVEPVEGGEPSERTEVRVAFDDDALYLAVRCLDADPDAVVAKGMRRDGDLSGDDQVGVLLGPWHDHRNGYLFATNPNGARFDALVENNRALRVEWDGIWRARARRDAEGWSAELAIPWKTLSFEPGRAWDFNVERVIARRGEVLRWTSALQNRQFRDLGRVGDLTGLGDVAQGLGLDVVPAVTARWRERRREERTTRQIDPSLDVFWRPEPRTTAALTLNPDFSDAPVDPRRVNLTRFALFFPETRDFFLQDAGIFDFADLSGRNGVPFFTRRIGVGAGGEVVDVRGAVKATGRVGRLNFGLLDAQMEPYDDVEAKNLSAARLKWNWLEESTVGAIATHGDPVTNGSSSLLGADFLYRNGALGRGGDQIFEAFGWLQRSLASDPAGDGAAFGGTLAWPNDRWFGRLRYADIGRDFRPALGFVNRPGVRQWELILRRRFRPAGGPVRTADVIGEVFATTDRDGHLESLGFFPTLFELASPVGDSLALRVWSQREVLDAPFAIAPGVVLPEDRYDFHRVVGSFGTAPSRPLAVRAELGAGSFFSGHIRALVAGIDLRPSRFATASVEFEQNQVRLREGDFTTRLVRLYLALSVSPDLTFDHVIQWDSQSDALGWNARLRWILEPGREVVVVLNHLADTRGASWRGVESDLSARLGWTFRF